MMEDSSWLDPFHSVAFQGILVFVGLYLLRYCHVFGCESLAEQNEAAEIEVLIRVFNDIVRHVSRVRMFT